MKTFEELGLDSRILRAITEMGFEKPMPVQEAVIPVLLEMDTDLVALAQTGTGKTAAFGLPLVQKIDKESTYTQALILCPTRELCMQIAGDIKDYTKYVDNFRVVPVYGGASIETQIRQLSRGVHIIVATPGRMLDLMRRGKINLTKLKYVVFDEADEMLDMGFQDDMNSILEETPKEKNTLLFSATMPVEIEKIARGYMNHPVEITVGNRNSGSENVKHYYYLSQARQRYLVLKRIADFYPDIYAIIFCRTRAETQEVADALIKDGYNADALHGDLSQLQRDNVMNKFRLRNLQMLVATDVAARGLDVNDLTHVINYNLPDEIEQYTHRSGRTGRADKSGISIAILNLREKHKVKQLERSLGKTFKYAKIPSGKEVCEKQLFHMINKMETVVVNEEEINKFLPVINQKLDWLSKEELIKRFVSVEFNRFINYYRNAPDLNVDDRHDTSGEPRRSNEEFVRLFINLGKIDGIGPTQLIGLINDTTQTRDMRIGRIEMLNTFSFFEIDSKHLDQVIEAFKTAKYQSRKVSIEVANKKTERGGGGGDRRRSEGGDRRRSDSGYSRDGGSSRDGGGSRDSGSRDRSFGGGDKKKDFKKDTRSDFRDKDKGKPKKKRW
ncbi:MAG: DEAD/DEAH box helicase [Bacteroidota bacterium]